MKSLNPHTNAAASDLNRGCLRQEEGEEPNLEQIAEKVPELDGEPQALQEELTDDPEYDPDSNSVG